MGRRLLAAGECPSRKLCGQGNRLGGKIGKRLAKGKKFGKFGEQKASQIGRVELLLSCLRGEKWPQRLG